MFGKRSNIWLLLIVLCWGCESCTSRAVHDAESVVAQADSLRAEGRMYGIDEGDSATLAQAYETLSIFNSPLLSTLNPQLSTVFSHSCYHYGRLLREKDNPVEAMQVFINATHSRTHDYHILGRVYSNMGSICHLAGDYPLSYDMYEKSAQVFLQGEDTLLYYYGLNNMAFELAEQGKKEEAFEVLNRVDAPPTEDYLVAKLWETKAEIYRIAAQYDSAIFCANQLEYLGYTEPAIILIKSQSYYELSIIDSALMYANMILNDNRASYQDRFNALYIITQYDSTLCSQDICDMASERKDIRYYEYEPVHEKCVKAVRLLEQDMQKGIDWYKWILFILVIACGIGVVILTKKWRVYKHHTHDQIDALTKEREENIIESIKNHIEGKDYRQTLHWNNYYAMKADVDLYMGGLAKKLDSYNLNEVQLRFCILTMLDFPLRKIAKEMNYSYPSAIKTLKKRTSDKLGTTPPKLKEFLLHL